MAQPVQWTSVASAFTSVYINSRPPVSVAGISITVSHSLSPPPSQLLLVSRNWWSVLSPPCRWRLCSGSRRRERVTTRLRFAGGSFQIYWPLFSFLPFPVDFLFSCCCCFGRIRYMYFTGHTRCSWQNDKKNDVYVRFPPLAVIAYLVP